MTGLIIFLSVILAVFAIAAIVLLVLVISLAHKINRTQSNVKLISDRFDKTSSLMTIGSSVLAVVGGLMAKQDKKKAKRKKCCVRKSK